MIRFAVSLLFAGSVFADQVTLANGDRLSGSIQRLSDDKLVVVTEMAGAVVIPWPNVVSIVSAQPLYLRLKSGQVLSGSVIKTPKGLRVDNSGQAWDIAKSDIATMRSYQEQRAYQRVEERKQAPHFLDPWTGFLDIGASATQGNTDVATVSVGMNAVRARTADKLILNFNALYTRNSTAPPATVTSDLKRGGARYEVNFNPRRFAFFSADFEADALQKLDLRSVGGLGYGQHIIKTKETTFDLFGGGTVNREVFSGLHRLNAEVLLAEESSHKLNKSFTLKQKLGVFPNLTDTGQYRLTFDSAAVTSLLRWLSWQVSFSDRYISDPVPGTVKNDVLVTTGFRFTLLPPR